MRKGVILLSMLFFVVTPVAFAASDCDNECSLNFDTEMDFCQGGLDMCLEDIPFTLPNSICHNQYNSCYTGARRSYQSCLKGCPAE